VVTHAEPACEFGMGYVSSVTHLNGLSHTG
jgi:hypothetical protein